MNTKELALIMGARPNFMKVAPLYRTLAEDARWKPILVHTGQHYDVEMSDVFIEQLGLPMPDHSLDIGPGTHAEQTANVMLRLEPLLTERPPRALVVVGDVNSTLAAALTAAKLGIPVIHVEAGLRSNDRTMPEEINRQLTDALGDLLLAPSADAIENLSREGVTGDRVRMVGNVMIDSLERLLPAARSSGVVARMGLRAEEFLLATLHRPSNVDTPDALEASLEVLAVAAERFPLVLVVHPRTQQKMSDFGLVERLPADRTQIVPALGYVEFLALESAAAGVLTDSGGVQEETTVLGVRCLTMRPSTERPITVTHGTNVIVGLDIDLVREQVTSLSEGGRPSPRRPPLWDGHAAERIVSALNERYA